MCCDHPPTANIVIAQLNPDGVSQENRNLSRSLTLLSRSANTEDECGHRVRLQVFFISGKFQVFLKLLNLGISQSEQHVITSHVKNK